MKNRITVTILALSVSLYGFAGLWINLGNETIDPPQSSASQLQLL